MRWLLLGALLGLLATIPAVLAAVVSVAAVLAGQPLAESGLSTRAIGAAVGVSEATVRREMSTASSALGNDAVEPRRVIGVNGKTYTQRPEPPSDTDLFAGEDWVQPSDPPPPPARTCPSWGGGRGEQRAGEGRPGRG